MASTGALVLVDDEVTTISAGEYLAFFQAIGFQAFDYSPYHPFHHEIVEVVEDPNWTEEPLITDVFWPGLRFGDMLFSRAGVQLWCAPETFHKRMAENSCLYFTYWRQRREVADQSHGWGRNSQWGTSFRRDYEADGFFHFNVDAKHPLDDEKAFRDSFSSDDWKFQRESDEELGVDALTLEECRELLMYRSFVRCTKRDSPRYPYEHRYSLAKSDH